MANQNDADNTVKEVSNATIIAEAQFLNNTSTRKSKGKSFEKEKGNC